jgi:hypothetical protein
MTRLSLQCALMFLGAALFTTPIRAEISQFSKNHPVVKLGNADAQLKLGLSYENGRGVPQDYAKAALWFRRAACQGNVDAQMKISEAYYLGRGVPKDYVLAGWWMMKVATKRATAAEQKRSEREAKAAQGDAEAQKQLRNATVEFMKLIEAAEQEDADAQNKLGLVYGLGKGVPQNDAKAAAWHRRAAEQGNPQSQSLLAIAHAEGVGVARNHVEALKWLNILLAQTKGSDRPVIKMVISLTAKNMTQEQILEAQTRAVQWTPTSRKNR